MEFLKRILGWLMWWRADDVAKLEVVDAWPSKYLFSVGRDVNLGNQFAVKYFLEGESTNWEYVRCYEPGFGVTFVFGQDKDELIELVKTWGDNSNGEFDAWLSEQKWLANGEVWRSWEYEE